MKKVICMVTVIVILLMATLTGCSGQTTASSAAASTAAAAATSAPASVSAAASASAAVSASAATSAAASSSTDLVKPNKKMTIAMDAFNVAANSYTTVYDKTIKDLATKAGVTLIVDDPKGDAALQASQVEDLIQQKPDVMIIWPCDGTAIVASMKKVSEAKIPLVIGNSAPDKSGDSYLTAFVGPNQKEEGNLAGQLMVKALNGAGNVVELMGSAGYSVSQDRHDGFMDAIKDSKIKVLDSQPADWNTEKARQLMETYLQKYPDQINGVYCADDGISAGVMQALDAAGKNDGSIKITTATIFSSGYDAIVKGLEYGSVVQSPIVEATLTLNSAIRIGNGEKVDSTIYFHCPTCTKDTASQIEKPVW